MLSMVPVRAVGFEALRTRIETQDRQCQAHRIKLEVRMNDRDARLAFNTKLTLYLFTFTLQQLDQKMKEVRRKHTIETIVKLQEYKRRHIDLTQRVIQVRRRKKKTCGHLLAFCLTACY
jgi:hypothetical protein